jgi:hypothetical protein
MTSPERPPYGRRPDHTAPGGPFPPAGPPALRLGHLVPERRPVVVTRPNPEWTALGPEDPKRAILPEMVDVILQGYVFGPRCPGVVKAELSSIEETYRRSLQASVGEGGPETISTSMYIAAWHTFLRESIQALVPGLTPGECDVLAAEMPGSSGGPATELLRYLELWSPPSEAGPAGDDADPEVVGEAAPPAVPSTTAPSSPSSPPSTDSDPPSS